MSPHVMVPAPSDAHVCDPVTGLPTRAVLLQAVGRMLESARRTGSAVAVLNIQLVGAGATEAMGAAPLLRDSADVLRMILREWGIAARVAGAGFVVALPEVRHPSIALGTARQLHRALRGLHRSAGRIGVALYPDDAADPESLVQAAARSTPTTDAIGFARLPARLPAGSATAAHRWEARLAG